MKKLLIGICLLGILLLSGCSKKETDENFCNTSLNLYDDDGNITTKEYCDCMAYQRVRSDDICGIKNGTIETTETITTTTVEPKTVNVYKEVCDEYESIAHEGCLLNVDSEWVLNSKCHELGLNMTEAMAKQYIVLFGNVTKPYLESSTSGFILVGGMDKCIKSHKELIGTKTLSTDGTYWIYSERTGDD